MVVALLFLLTVSFERRKGLTSASTAEIFCSAGLSQMPPEHHVRSTLYARAGSLKRENGKGKSTENDSTPGVKVVVVVLG